MKKFIKIKIMCIVFTLISLNWIFTRPNIYQPFSPYSAWDEGHKIGYGEYPPTCDTWNCRVHHKGFWNELVSSENYK